VGVVPARRDTAPCFELWLLLHQQDYTFTSYVDGYDDAVARLRNYLPNYDKSQLDFADFAAGVSRAIEKAKVLDPGKNPSSSVWQLVEKMMEQ
jgi:hypothetical protein